MKQLPIGFTFVQKVVLVSFLALLTLIVISQANPFQFLPGRDNGTFLYIGNHVLSGKLPYKDAWDSKPPAIFYVNALGLWLGKGSRIGVWFLEFCAIFIAALFGYTFLRRLWGNQAALFGTLVWLYGLNLTLEGGNLTEEFSLPFSFFALLIFLFALEKPNTRLPDVLLGILFVINFLFRPNNTMTQVAIVLTLILLCFIHRTYRLLIFRLGAMAIGVFAIILIPVLYFWSKDILLEFYNAAIAYNFTYSSTTIVGGTNPLRNGFIILKASIWVALFGFILSCILLIRSIQTKKTIPPTNLFILICGLIFAPLTDPAGRTYTHYYMNWLPLVAVSSGFLYSALQKEALTRTEFLGNKPIRDTLIALLLALMITITSGAGRNYAEAIERLSTGQVSKFGRRSPIARYVNNHTEPGDLVYFWGGFPGENFMSQRDAPTAYIYFPTYLESDLADEMNNAFLEDLKAQPPVLMIDMNYQRALSFDPETRAAQLSSGVNFPYLPKNLDEVYEFINTNYYLVATVDGRNVYRLYGTDDKVFN
jgi:hypothetical protein